MNEAENKVARVLFVCLGNICRSPAAEAIFLAAIKAKNLHKAWVVDSAGTSSFHGGKPADERMIEACTARGYAVKSISRGFDPTCDFDEFDWILGMDVSNVENLKQMARDGIDAAKVMLYTEFHPKKTPRGVPDPYYGSGDGFAGVVRLAEEITPNLISAIEQGLSS